MKIAYLLGSLNRGGTETLLLDTYRQAKDANMDIIGVYRKDGLLYKDFKNSGVQITRLKPRFFLDLLYFFHLRKLLKGNKVDIVHAQQVIDAIYAWISCRGTGIKVLLTLHGYNFRYGRKINTLTQFIINRTRLNIYVSKSQKTNYQEKYKIKKPQNQVVVYNGVSFDKFNNIERKSLKKEFNIPEKTLLLGSVGNFVGVRDQITICRFLDLLNQKGIDFAFVFAGRKSDTEPWYFDNCIQYCKDHDLSRKVFFPGSRKDIPNMLSQLDAFIYSTSHDTFGIAIIEAMAMGVSVFTNDWEVMTEITDKGQHGIIYKTKDEKDLLHKFMHFLENREIYQGHAREDAVWVRKQYSIQTHLDSLKQIYQSIHEG